MINLSDTDFCRSKPTLRGGGYRMTPEQINIVRLKERLEDIEYPNKDFWMRKLNQCYFGEVSVKLKRRIITMLTKRLIKD